MLSGLALERRDFDVAERFAEHALSLTERWRPIFEFLTLLEALKARVAEVEGKKHL